MSNRRKRLQDDIDRLREDRNLKVYAALLILLIGSFATVMLNSAFAGGWEISSSFEEVTIDDQTFTITGDHDSSIDIDGSYNRAVEDADGDVSGIYPAGYDNPEVVSKSSYPHYIEKIGGVWVAIDEEDVEPLDFYQVEISNDTFQTYKHWTIGVDVDFETAAEDYYLPPLSYYPYGYSFEKKTVEIESEIDVSLTPWTPVGTLGNYSVIGGWSGIMSASIAAVSFGQVDADAEENFGHTIQGLHSVGQALNMEGGYTVSFDNPAALEGIPTSVGIELRAELGAGAKYTTDGLGFWDSIAVRNVFVKYTIRIDFLTTLIYFNLGHQDELEDPDEDNTAYQPEITPWKNFFDNIAGFFSNPFTIVFIAIILIIGLGIVVIVLKRG